MLAAQVPIYTLLTSIETSNVKKVLLGITVYTTRQSHHPGFDRFLLRQTVSFLL